MMEVESDPLQSDDPLDCSNDEPKSGEDQSVSFWLKKIWGCKKAWHARKFFSVGWN